MTRKSLDVICQFATPKDAPESIAARHSLIREHILLAQGNYSFRFLEFFIFVCIFLISPSTSVARIICHESSPNSVILDIGTITWPAGISTGGTVKTLPSQQFAIACHYAGDPASSDVSGFVNFQSGSATQSGSDDIFLTNQPGTGIRYSFSSANCSVADPILRKDTVLSFTCLAPGNAARTFIIDVRAALIATGSSVTAGNFTSAALIGLTYIPGDTNNVWVKNPVYSGAAQGTLVPSTCSVLSPSLNVAMPNISAQAFKGGIGTVSGQTPFALKYRCTAGAQLYLTLTDNTDPTNRTNLLTLTPDSTVSGASIQITNDSGPISFGPDSTEAGVINQWNIGASPDGILDIPLHARYVRTATIIPGSVKALATFTMSFQ